MVEKALFFASRILAWDPAIGSIEAGRERAEKLLRSGAARTAFEGIIDAQGRRSPPVMPGRLIHTFHADHAGAIREIDGWAVTEIARCAGAPLDKAAGVDILRNVGDTVECGEPLFVIHASAQGDLEEAARLAGNSQCYVIG